MVTDPSVVRSVTLIGLAELIGYRTEPLVAAERLRLTCQVLSWPSQLRR